MAEKSDDIKNLFLNLGLNPSDYHEIRSAPTANVTVSEAPRRWSLLQPAGGAQPPPLSNLSAAAAAVPAPIVRPAVTPAVTPPVAAAPVEAKVTTASAASISLPAALLAAAQDIARAESKAYGLADSPVSIAAPVPAPTPAPVSTSPADGLQSLFQSVKEPQAAIVQPSAEIERPTERRTDQLYGRTPVAVSPAARAAGMPETRPALLPEPARRLTETSDEPETRRAPPSRLGPVPAPAAAVSVTRSAAAPAAPAPLVGGRLRFSSNSGGAVDSAAAASPRGESLQDVFQRLTRHNRN